MVFPAGRFDETSGIFFSTHAYRPRMRPFAFLLALLALALPAGADHCAQPDYGRASEELRIHDRDGATRWYVDVDTCQTQGCITSVWVYEETNGFENLQRRDGTPEERARRPWYQDDTCHGAIAPDTVVASL